VKRNEMDVGIDVGEVYGHVVCLVAILVFVFGSYRLTEGILNFRELQFTEVYTTGPTLTSLSAYKMELLRRLHPAELDAASVVPPDSTLQAMFEQERLYRLALGHQVYRTAITLNAVLVAIAILLFGFHWRGLQRRQQLASEAESPSRPHKIRHETSA
jgi:hypothetical protein